MTATLPRRSLVDDDAQTALERDGFVVGPMLARSEVTALLDAIAELRPADRFAPTQGPSYHCSFLDADHDYRRAVFDLLSRTFAAHVEHRLVGYRILNCNFYVKPPGTGEFSVHQNWPTLPDLDDTSVTIWCPLQDTDLENGTLEVVAGSHKLMPHVEAPGTPGYFSGPRDFTDGLIRDYLRPVPMRAGDAIIFDDSLLHWSGANRSAAPRIAVQLLCIPGDVSPVMFLPHDADHFELIDADQTFYLTHDAADLAPRRPEWRHRGFVANRNRALGADEFDALLRDARARRGTRDFSPAPVVRPRPPVPKPAEAPRHRPLLQRIRHRLRRLA